MKGRKWVPALIVVAAAGGAGCQQSSRSAPAAEVRPAAAEIRFTAPPPPVARSGRHFEPPADGRLTPAQVEAYIAVRRQAMAMPKKASTLAAQLADLAASERQALTERGLSVDEHRWVSARVAEASPPAADALGAFAGAIEAGARRGREQVFAKAAGGRPAVTSGEAVPDDSARAYNRSLLDRYRSELDALNATSVLPVAPTGSPRS